MLVGYRLFFICDSEYNKQYETIYETGIGEDFKAL